MTKIIEERDKRKQPLEATVKTVGVVPQSKISEKPETVEKSPEVKVKTSEKIVTPELARGIMQNTPESKSLTAVNDTLTKVQSTLLTIGQAQVMNANNTNTINNNTSNVKNEDNRKILQEERKLEKEREKIEEKNAKEEKTPPLKKKLPSGHSFEKKIKETIDK